MDHLAVNYSDDFSCLCRSGALISFSHPLARQGNGSPQSLQGCSMHMAKDLASNPLPSSQPWSCLHCSFTNHPLHQKPVSMWCAYNNDLILGNWVVISTISLLRDAPFNIASCRITGTHALIRRNKLRALSPN